MASRPGAAPRLSELAHDRILEGLFARWVAARGIIERTAVREFGGTADMALQAALQRNIGFK
jgi:hypothetical protein